MSHVATKPATPQEQEVAALLAAANIPTRVTHLHQTKLDGWECDRWSVSIWHAEFDYHTGMGHRKIPSPAGWPRWDNTLRPGTLAYEAQEQRKVPVAPHVAGVLHSLILDSRAAEQTFSDWCSDFGFDTDSRKAFATYDACQQTADKLRRVIPRDMLAQIATALENY